MGSAPSSFLLTNSCVVRPLAMDCGLKWPRKTYVCGGTSTPIEGSGLLRAAFCGIDGVRRTWSHKKSLHVMTTQRSVLQGQRAYYKHRPRTTKNSHGQSRTQQKAMSHGDYERYASPPPPQLYSFI